MSASGRPPVCAESEPWGAELALGLLSGPERAAGLSHLASCSSCREQVDDLARVVDRLLLLTPDAEPPAGFESRVLAAVASNAGGGGGRTLRSLAPRPVGRVPAGSGGRVGGGRARRRVPLVAGLVVAAAIGGGAVTAVLHPSSAGDATSLRTGLAVSASGRTSCRVVVSGGRPASVLISLDGYPGGDDAFTVEMETVTGAAVPLGPLPVAAGHGLLVSRVDVDADSLRLMRMLDQEGRVVYEATLHDQPGL